MSLKHLLLKLRSPALLAILIGLAFWFHFQWCVRGDDLNYSYPQYLYNYARLLNLELPDWCPNAAGGFPWQGEHQHPFSPTMFLGYLVNPGNFIPLHDITVILVAALMTFALARRLGATRLGGFVASLMFIGSGSLVDPLREGYSGHLAGCCYIPLVAYCLLRLRETPGPTWAILTALAVSVHYCTGHFQVFYYAVLWLTAWYIFLLLDRREDRGTALGAGLAAAALFLLFAAADWLPRMAASSLMVETPRHFLGAPLTILGFSTVGAMGTPLTVLHKQLIGHGDRFNITYMGFFAVAAMATAMIQRDRLRWFLILSALVCFLMSLGPNSALSMGALKVLPGLGFMKKLERFFYAINLPVALLGGFGVSYVASAAFHAKRQILRYGLMVCCIAMAVLVTTAASFFVAGSIRGATFENMWKGYVFLQPREEPFTRMTVYLGITSMILVPLLSWIPKANLRALAVAALALACTISFQVEAGLEKEQFRDPYTRAKPLRKIIDEDDTLFRVTTVMLGKLTGSGVPRRYLLRSGQFPINTEIATSRYCTTNGLTVFKLPRFAELAWHANGYPPDIYRTQLNSSRYVFTDPTSRFLDYYNVKYIIASEKLGADHLEWVRSEGRGSRWEHLYRNKRVLPRAWLATDYEIIEDKQKIWARMVEADFDPLTTAILESPPELPARTAEPRAEGDRAESLNTLAVRKTREGKTPSVVSILQLGDDDLQYRVDAPDDGVLVLSENYCEGWKAEVNGAPVAVQPAFFSLRGVPVPAGESVVKLSYRSPYLRAGLWTSSLSIPMAMIVLVWVVVRKRRAS